MMRIVKYRRVSTIMQVEKGVSLQTQAERLDAFILSQGWTCVGDYVDDGYSAKDLNRPEMQRLIEDIKKEKFDIIIVYRLDRFVRSVTDLHFLLKLMEKHNIKFKSATEIYDTTTAAGRLFITLVAAMAQWERETIGERVYENMLERSENGFRNGAPAPYGYDLVEGKLILNKEEAKWLHYMFTKYLTHGAQWIAKQLNRKGIPTKKGERWSDFSVRYVLRNPIYTGKIRWNYRTLSTGKLTGEEVIRPIDQDDFEPIISDDLFQEVQELLKKRRHMAFRSDNHYPYSGIAKCAKCGRSFSGSQKHRKSGSVYRFYKCRGRFNFGDCDVQTIAEESIEKAFLESLVIPNSNDININSGKFKIDPESLQNDLSRLQQKKERAEEMYLEGDINRQRYKTIINKTKEQEMELRRQIDSAKHEASQQEILSVLNDLKKEWHNFSYEAKKRAIHSIFESITIKVVQPSIPGKYPKPPVIEITDFELKKM